tara:strand:+ start:234 stop:482 length:249 start_codon:yes stop_codon:yes gene_type:complete
MSLINLHLDIETEYKNLIKDVYKIVVILCVFQTMVYYSDNKNLVTTSLNGTLLNDDLLILILYVIIAFTSYHFVFEKILKIT